MLKTLRLRELCGFAFNPKSASAFIYFNAKPQISQRNFLIFRNNIAIEIPKVSTAQKGKMEIHDKRWIVGRTISWTLNITEDVQKITKEKLRTPMHPLF